MNCPQCHDTGELRTSYGVKTCECLTKGGDASETTKSVNAAAGTSDPSSVAADELLEAQILHFICQTQLQEAKAELAKLKAHADAMAGDLNPAYVSYQNYRKDYPQ